MDRDGSGFGPAEFGLTAKVLFIVDAMYYHAARQSFARATSLAENADRALGMMRELNRRWAELEEERREEEESGDDHAPAGWHERQERLAIQMESAEYAVGEAYGPYLQALATTHILCAAALESHINIRAKELLDGKALRRFLKKSVRDKWLDLPNELGKKGFAPDEQPYKGFTKLVEIRNALVHYKWREELWGSKTGVPAFVEEMGLTREAAAESLEAARGMIFFLARLLGQEPPHWLDVEGISYFEFRIEANDGS